MQVYERSGYTFLTFEAIELPKIESNLRRAGEDRDSTRWYPSASSPARPKQEQEQQPPPPLPEARPPATWPWWKASTAFDVAAWWRTWWWWSYVYSWFWWQRYWNSVFWWSVLFQGFPKSGQ